MTDRLNTTTRVVVEAETIRFNNDQTVKTDVGEFYVEQRNAGFAVNDGSWNVTQGVELYWSLGGVLRSRRDSKFLGNFATIAEAEAAIAGAELMPINDRMVR